MSEINDLPSSSTTIAERFWMSKVLLAEHIQTPSGLFPGVSSGFSPSHLFHDVGARVWWSKAADLF